MQNKMILQLSAIASALVLAACGGGGGSGINNPNTENTNTTSNASTNTNAITNNSGSSNNNSATNNHSDSNANNNADKTYSSAVIFAVKDGTRGEGLDYLSKTTTLYAHDGNSFNKLSINGVEITLIDDGIVSGGWTNVSKNGESKHIYAGMNHTRFGVYTKQEQDHISHIYTIAHGQMTDESKVPQTGVATYSGNAILNGHFNGINTKGIGAATEDGWLTAKSNFNVDYGNKSISGSISSPDNHFANIDLKGTISSNGFSGKNDSNNVYMNGKFFGTNAEELGGSFYKQVGQNQDVLIGAFGASKQ